MITNTLMNFLFACTYLSQKKKSVTPALLFTFKLNLFILMCRAQGSHKVIVCIPNVSRGVINHIDLNCLTNVSAVTLLL